MSLLHLFIHHFSNIRKTPAAKLVFVLTILSQCIYSQGPQKLRIDPSQALGGTVSQLFEEVNYIPLETTSASLFGRVNQLFVTDSFFIILDHDTNSILLFDKTGKFHCRILGGNASKKVAPTGIRFFVLNKFKSEISFKIGNTRIAVYNFDGKKIREEEILPCNAYSYLTPNTLVYTSYNFNKKQSVDSIDYEITWQQDGQVPTTAMSYPIRNSPFAPADILHGTSSPFSQNLSVSTIFYTRPYDYSIFELSSSQIQVPFTLVLPMTISLPPDFTTSKEYYDKRFIYLTQKNPAIVYKLSNIYKLNKLLFFKLETGMFNLDNTFIYDLSTSTLLSVNHIDPDETNYFLPTKSFSSVGFLAASGNYVYTAASSLDMFNAAASVENKVKYNGKIKEYFKKSNKSSNPVIIMIKPRQQFNL